MKSFLVVVPVVLCMAVGDAVADAGGVPVVRATECVARGPTAIDRLIAVVEAARAAQALSPDGSVVVERREDDAVVNRELCFLADAKFRLAGPPSRRPDNEEGSHLWRTEGKGESRRHWWYERLRDKRAEALASGGEFDIVMMGDSITHMIDRVPGSNVMEGFLRTFRTLNLGYGGDHAETLLWRARNGELDGYRAKVVTILIGTNNQGARDTVESTVAAVREAITAVREKQPQAKILLMRLFPRLSGKLAKMRSRSAIAVSSELRKFVDEKDVIWVDVNDLWIGPDGRGRFDLLTDGTHPGPAGVVAWMKALMPYFEKYTGKRYDFPPLPESPCPRRLVAVHADFADEDSVHAIRDVAVRAAMLGYNGVCLTVDGDRASWDDKAKTRYDDTLATFSEAGLELVSMQGRTPGKLGLYVFDVEKKRFDGVIEMTWSFTRKPDLWNEENGGFVYLTSKGDYSLLGDVIRTARHRSAYCFARMR